jgi:hypothetical protein
MAALRQETHMSQPTTSIVFSCDELWLLQSTIRHEVAQMEQWRVAPASPSLNDQVADALYRCTELNIGEAAVLVTRGDCLAIDYCVPQGAKSASGTPIGKSILMKSFKARRELDEGPELSADEPEQVSAVDVREQLRRLKGE